MARKIREEIYKEDIYFNGLKVGTDRFDEFIKAVNNPLVIEISLDMYYDHFGDEGNIKITIDRPETSEEQKAREARSLVAKKGAKKAAVTRKLNKAARERKQYEQLKKKYG